ncbi:P-loop NTPase [Halorubrum sp. CBA1125]|uniref:P-loop NTPase n=1 Tax=Halorubrum sp. CBA1125 TaxID=2668072 RepID=UPI0012E8718E|nr:P-loop NTPase [Halorubrum sp. CBA1125]MUW15453.1 P-loop NTPase [Halorubrum sp. CBA1125]
MDDAIHDDVEAALRKVRDPEADLSVFEAGLIENIHTTDGTVVIEVDLHDFPPQEAESVTATLVEAASAVEGVERAHVERVPDTPDTDGRAAGIATADRVIAVASAKGGVGKSTVATGLARALAADGEAVGLFDADIHGPNVPELLEVSGPVHSDDEGNPIPVETRGIEVMSVGLMSDSAPLAWRGAMAHDALSELFEDTRWRDPDTVVIDLPPGTGDIALTTLQSVPIDGVVFVTTPFHAAVSDTHRSLQLFEENDVPVLGIVSNMGEFVCDECGEPHELFGEGDPIAALNRPVLSELPFTEAMQTFPTASDDHLPSSLRALADAVRRRYDEIWSVDVPSNALDIRGLSAEDRYDAVETHVANGESGTTMQVVSDRDPAPLRSYLIDLVDDIDSLERFAVKQQNPETWLVRTVRP